eukprot:5271952-Karenia_brevis.AAC.1
MGPESSNLEPKCCPRSHQFGPQNFIYETISNPQARLTNPDHQSPIKHPQSEAGGKGEAPLMHTMGLKDPPTAWGSVE